MKSLLMGMVFLISLAAFAEGAAGTSGPQNAGTETPTQQQQGQGQGSAGPQGQNNKPPRPPKEALDACQSKKAGDACAFSGRSGEKSGTCFTPDPAKPLACRPGDGPHR